jgi:hypothetical protein
MNDFYKLLANSLFGKTCENPEKYRKLKFFNGTKKILEALNSLNVKSFHYIDKQNEVILAEIMKAQVKYDKPLLIGVTILELSKLHMQRYYYEILKPYYGERMKFLYTDTDSFFLELETESFKKDLEDSRLKPYFETKETEGNLGIMKIEKEGIVEFKAYCPKHYYYIFKTPTRYDFSEAFKGIPKLTRLVMDTQGIEEHLKKGQARELSISEFIYLHITSKNHEIVLKDTIKKVTDTDDKRHYIDGIHSLALGHYRLS